MGSYAPSAVLVLVITDGREVVWAYRFQLNLPLDSQRGTVHLNRPHRPLLRDGARSMYLHARTLPERGDALVGPPYTTRSSSASTSFVNVVPFANVPSSVTKKGVVGVVGRFSGC